MGKLRKRVKEVLEQTFDDLLDGLDEYEGRVTGFVASKKFDRLDDAARQKRLWKVLEKGLTAEELRNVGPIATLGQKEAAFPFDG